MIYNFTVLLLVFFAGFIADKNAVKSNYDLTGSTSSVKSTTPTTVVSATRIDGEVIPYVTLPEFSVVAFRNENVRVQAQIINGEVIPFVQLPELSIYAN